ncbi:Crp/Fnr family transcriptional regulator [Chenggangzhangella methanolivorans]|uniref:Crp/Fnr family transcriptional regulator n=1 Tax=Chenggangzhangella methanolivorans TaxID=1437009 RepID=A0A9E6RCJ4_9HYPH|nr:Crp/Fnr family transcriptional regulator [Chenggangzhangella methanolivorans]QZO01350.1 Crp/Fnr family transcriptional regulator [Chenggangzhangella methanolivorans]
MHVRCTQCVLRRQPAFIQKSDEEVALIDSLKSEHMTVEAGVEFIHPEQADSELYTLFSGWAFRYKELSDGRRQILSFSLPGDLLGLQGTMFGKSVYGAIALTDIQLCVIPRRRLARLFERVPEVAYEVTWLGARSEAIVDENLLNVGRRGAAERIVALICSLYKRAEPLGLVVDGSFELPLTQQHIADALGLSLVHTNKTLARLRADGLFSISGGRLVVRNLRGLSRFAQHFEEEFVPRPII